MSVETPREKASKELDDAISRFKSPDQHRLAIYHAHLAQPNDEKLSQALKRLTDVPQVQKEAQTGVFISYSREDELFALDLAERLNDHEVKVWLDIMAIHDDSDWYREVEAAMKTCGVMVAVLSPYALHNQELVSERQRFDQQGKLTIPVIHQTCQVRPGAFWVTPVDLSHDFDRGFGTLLRFLSSSAAMF